MRQSASLTRVRATSSMSNKMTLSLIGVLLQRTILRFRCEKIRGYSAGEHEYSKHADTNECIHNQVSDMKRWGEVTDMTLRPACPGPLVFRFAKMTWARTAPSFPDAAEIPCAVARYRVGKTSPGMTNVVVFGPKF